MLELDMYTRNAIYRSPPKNTAVDPSCLASFWPVSDNLPSASCGCLLGKVEGRKERESAATERECVTCLGRTEPPATPRNTIPGASFPYVLTLIQWGSESKRICACQMLASPHEPKPIYRYHPGSTQVREKEMYVPRSPCVPSTTENHRPDPPVSPSTT